MSIEVEVLWDDSEETAALIRELESGGYSLEIPKFTIPTGCPGCGGEFIVSLGDYSIDCICRKMPGFYTVGEM